MVWRLDHWRDLLGPIVTTPSPAREMAVCSVSPSLADTGATSGDRENMRTGKLSSPHYLPVATSFSFSLLPVLSLTVMLVLTLSF